MEQNEVDIEKLVADYKEKYEKEKSIFATYDNELSSSEYNLINLLVANPNGLEIEEICDFLPNDFPRNDKSARNICGKVYQAVKHINKSLSVNEIISIVGRKKNRKFKLVEKTESENYMKKLYSQAMRRLFEYSCLKKKLSQVEKDKIGEQVKIDE